MKSIELPTARKLPGFSAVGAAEHIGGVAGQRWQYFEIGKRDINFL